MSRCDCGVPDSAAHLLLRCPAHELTGRRLWSADPSPDDVLSGPAAKMIDFLRGVGRNSPTVDPPTHLAS